MGEGEDEVAALTYLALKLCELRDVERRMALEAKARTAFLHRAEGALAGHARTAAYAGRAGAGLARYR